MENRDKVNLPRQIASLEEDILVYRNRIQHRTTDLDEALGTSVHRTPEYGRVIEALTKYAEYVRTLMPQERR